LLQHDENFVASADSFCPNPKEKADSSGKNRPRNDNLSVYPQGVFHRGDATGASGARKCRGFISFPRRAGRGNFLRTCEDKNKNGDPKSESPPREVLDGGGFAAVA
jgi:hypothetical protein